MRIYRTRNFFIAMAARLAIAGSALLVAGPVLAADAVPGTPIAQTDAGRTAVRDCREADGLVIPAITWGADYATYHALGGATTQPGSLLDKAGIHAKLEIRDRIDEQLSNYLTCQTPFLRLTAGMAAGLTDVTEADPRTHMVPVYQFSWSAGGDNLVGLSDIRNPSDLKGKRVALQQNGPHVDYLVRLLKDGGLSWSDITPVWTRDLTGDGASTPLAMLQKGAADAAMLITPDMQTATAGGTGTGAEGSVRGAHTVISTRTANRIIADLLLVRQDYLDAHRDDVAKVVSALIRSEESIHQLMTSKGADGKPETRAIAAFFFGAGTPGSAATDLYSDAETVNLDGNIRFFTSPTERRRFETVFAEAAGADAAAGLISAPKAIVPVPWDWKEIGSGASLARREQVFKPENVHAQVQREQAQGIENSTVFTFDISFKPNQASFPVSLYRDEFDRVLDLSATYGGAVIVLEGNADPLGYLQAKAKGLPDSDLKRVARAGVALSLDRAAAVRAAIIDYAKGKNEILDPGKFEADGFGISRPKTGLDANGEPKAPQTRDEWLSNMRVTVRLVPVSAEATDFVLVHP